MRHRVSAARSTQHRACPRPCFSRHGLPCRSIFFRDRKSGRGASALARVEPHSATGTLRQRNGKQLAAPVILGFSRHMSGAIRSGSKLSACPTRQAGKKRPGAVFPLELGKGGNPPLHPPCRFLRHAETVPVSVPFGLHGAVAPSSSYEVCR
jgi:hypothetical protein